MILIFLFSNEISSTSSGHSTIIVNAVVNTFHVSAYESIVTLITRKAAHIFMYFVLGALIHNVVKEYKQTVKRTILLSVVFALTYASFDEIHQLFISGRSGEVRDVIIDTTASALGIGLFYLIRYLRSHRKHKKNKHVLRKFITKNKKQIYKWGRRIISIGLIASYVIAIYHVVNTKIVPIEYLGINIIVSALIVLYITINKFNGKLSHKKDTALTIVSLIIIILNICIIIASITTSSFLNGIQEKNYAYEEYNIIAISDQHISLVTNNKQKIGIIKTDINVGLVKAELRNKINIDYIEYNDLASITVALDNHSIDMAVIKTSHVQLLGENYDLFYRSFEILMSFKIKLATNNYITTADVTKPFILYISGVDTYGDISTVSRSDVNIIVVINPQTHKILLVTTPRDYYVQLHGTTGLKDKLTHSGIYGIDTSIKTMEDLYSIKIDYYLRINFSSLTKIVDAIGGVDVNSIYNFSAGGCQYHIGSNHLNGAQALAFSRERHSFEDGDRTRGENQERVIEAIITKMNNPSNLLNYPQVLSSLTDAFQTNMPAYSITSLINLQLNSMKKWQTQSTSVTGTGSTNITYSMGNIPLYVMEPNVLSIETAKQKISLYQ